VGGKMKISFLFVLLMITQTLLAQQYDSVIIETGDIDLNNQVYKTGNTYIYDYEIIENGESLKLNKNTLNEFELIAAPQAYIRKIYLVVEPTTDDVRTNKNQTEIAYLQEPVYTSFSLTGVVDNEHNIWMHPVRYGFFQSLETCPFPYIKNPIKLNDEWHDKMLIGESWGNEKWGKWKGVLLLNYRYKVTEKKTIATPLGELECYLVESTAHSSIGQTKLKTYYSTIFGFVRLEYELLTNIQVNFWLVDYMENMTVNDIKSLYKK
jgi:hypothetical protein